jgi:hypothetical protein
MKNNITTHDNSLIDISEELSYIKTRQNTSDDNNKEHNINIVSLSTDFNKYKEEQQLLVDSLHDRINTLETNYDNKTKNCCVIS